jgi:hypothetical protein
LIFNFRERVLAAFFQKSLVNTFCTGAGSFSSKLLPFRQLFLVLLHFLLGFKFTFVQTKPPNTAHAVGGSVYFSL